MPTNKKSLLIASTSTCFLIAFFSTFYIVKLYSTNTLPDIQAAINTENIVPAVVLGSGPAGLSAAMYLARAKYNTIVLTGPIPGGLLTHVKEIENLPGKAKSSGINVVEDLREQAENFGAQIINDTAVDLDLSVWPFVVKTRGGLTLRPLTLIIATGRMAKKRDVPGVNTYWGKGIGACTICEAPFQKGNIVAVFGGGSTATDRAQQLAAYAKKVYIICPTPTMTASTKEQEYLASLKNIEILLDTDLIEAKGNEKTLGSIVVKNNKTGQTTEIPARGLYFAIGYHPNSELVKNILETDENGLILLKGRTHATSVPGVFAGGDIVDLRYGKAGVATGSGIKAALDAMEFLQAIGYSKYAQELEKNFYNETRRKTTDLPSIATINQLKQMLIENPGLILIDFYSPECPQCRMIMPLVKAVAAEYADKVKVFKVNVDESDELWDHFEIPSVPYFLLFKEGKLIGEARDIQTKRELIYLIENFCCVPAGA
jgi:thioredoxin reductase